VWVLGNQATSSLDLAAVSQQLATRYVTDYESEWRAFLHSAAVVKYGGLKDAGDKLGMLSNPTSPLLELFYTVSHNTLVANADIAKEFQPTQAFVAPDGDRLMGQGNQAYVTGLLGLQTAVSQAAQDPTFKPDNPAQTGPIIQASGAAHAAASQAAQAFNLDPQAHVEQTVLALMQAPINSVDAVLHGQAQQAPNQGGKGLCAQFAPLMAKFPFSPNATADVTSAELAQVLQPGSGALWQFYNSNLKTALLQQGNTYVPAIGATTKINPDFLRFFNKAAALTAVLYPAGGGAGGLTFTAHILPSKGIQSIALVIDSQRLAGSDVSKQFTWSLATAQQAQLTANYSSGTLPLQFTGPWALFRLVNKGRLEPGGAGVRLAYPLEIAGTPIVVEGTPLVERMDLSGPNANLLMPGALSDMHCVSNVAK
jgi:type VI secretion system protein ImpL